MLELERVTGRLRGRRHALVAVPVLLAAWAWFGLPGSVPVVIWYWHRRPGGLISRERVSAADPWHIDLTRVRRARLGPWRTWIAFRGQRAVEIFNDELRPSDLALLRRKLKAQLAAG